MAQIATSRVGLTVPGPRDDARWLSGTPGHTKVIINVRASLTAALHVPSRSLYVASASCWWEIYMTMFYL